MAKITKRTVDALKPGAKPFIVFDDDVKGFGVRVFPSGVKSYVLEYRPGGGGRGVAVRRLTLGKHGAMTAEQARKSVKEALARVRLGQDPQEDKSRQRASLTVGGLIDAFLAEHVTKKCKSQTAIAHKIALERLRAAHGGRKAEALTRVQLEAIHRDAANTPYGANRSLAVYAKLFTWGISRRLLPEGHLNPAKGVERYREQSRERFLTTEELARLGDVLRQGETIGLPWRGEYESKHTPKEENRRTVLDPFAVAAIRLLILTGARLREILDAQWQHVDFERGILFLPDSKTGRKPVYLSAPALEVLSGLPRIEGNPHIIAGMKDGAPRADLKKPWAAVTKVSGLDGLRIHDLRHSFASVGAGASLGYPSSASFWGTRRRRPRTAMRILMRTPCGARLRRLAQR
jgi:integrase